MKELALGLVQLGVIIGWCLYFHRRGYKRGYERGRKDCEHWVCELDSSVEREREKMWKEGI